MVGSTTKIDKRINYDNEIKISKYSNKIVLDGWNNTNYEVGKEYLNNQ